MCVSKSVCVCVCVCVCVSLKHVPIFFFRFVQEFIDTGMLPNPIYAGSKPSDSNAEDVSVIESGS